MNLNLSSYFNNCYRLTDQRIITIYECLEINNLDPSAIDNLGITKMNTAESS